MHKKRGAQTFVAQHDLPVGPVSLAAAVIRQAVDDHAAGNDAAGLWLSSDHAAPWVTLAGLGDLWSGVLRRRGLLSEGVYVPETDADLPTEDGRDYGRVVLRYRKTRDNRRVAGDLAAALAACGGDLAAAVSDLRHTETGARLRAWLLGE